MDWTVDQILDYQTGVCSHKAKLFNAFLNCINIDSMYVTGFALTSNDANIDLDTLHAWTIQKLMENGYLWMWPGIFLMVNYL